MLNNEVVTVFNNLFNRHILTQELRNNLFLTWITT